MRCWTCMDRKLFSWRILRSCVAGSLLVLAAVWVPAGALLPLPGNFKGTVQPPAILCWEVGSAGTTVEVTALKSKGQNFNVSFPSLSRDFIRWLQYGQGFPRTVPAGCLKQSVEAGGAEGGPRSCLTCWSSHLQLRIDCTQLKPYKHVLSPERHCPWEKGVGKRRGREENHRQLVHWTPWGKRGPSESHALLTFPSDFIFNPIISGLGHKTLCDSLCLRKSFIFIVSKDSLHLSEEAQSTEIRTLLMQKSKTKPDLIIHLLAISYYSIVAVNLFLMWALPSAQKFQNCLLPRYHWGKETFANPLCSYELPAEHVWLKGSIPRN